MDLEYQSKNNDLTKISSEISGSDSTSSWSFSGPGVSSEDNLSNYSTAEHSLSLGVRRQSSSVWTRVFTVRPTKTSKLHRQFTKRQSKLTPVSNFGRKDILFIFLWIGCGWIFLGLNWSIYFIRNPRRTQEGNAIISTDKSDLSDAQTDLNSDNHQLVDDRIVTGSKPFWDGDEQDAKNEQSVPYDDQKTRNSAKSSPTNDHNTLEPAAANDDQSAPPPPNDDQPAPAGDPSPAANDQSTDGPPPQNDDQPNPDKPAPLNDTLQPNPIFFVYDLLEGEDNDLMFSWTKLCSKVLVFIPLANTISLCIYTNLLNFKGRKLAMRLIAIYLTHIVIAAPYETIRLYYMKNGLVLVTQIVCFYLVTTVVWFPLVRFLTLEWRVNTRWLPALQACTTAVFIFCHVPVLSSTSFINDILVFVPLVIMSFEYIIMEVLQYTFDQNKDNFSGLVLTIAYLLYPLEVTRFVSFTLLCIQNKNDYSWLRNSDVLLNVLFTTIGEIYSHTQIYQLLRFEYEMRCYGRLFDDRLVVWKQFSSIRFYLEYVAPTFLLSGVVLSNFCLDRIPIIDTTWQEIYLTIHRNLMKDIWPFVLLYYGVELVAEILCMAIRKLSSYKLESAIKKLDWSIIFLLIIYVGTAVEVPLTTTGYLRVLGTRAENNITATPPSPL